MRELQAIVLGLVVVVLTAVLLGFWHRPVPEFERIKAYRVEIREQDGESKRHVSFSVPASLLARAARLAPLREIGGDWRADWDGHELTANEILEAADRSSPGAPGIIEKDDTRIEVTSQGSVLEIYAEHDWDESVRIRIPRSVVESFSGDRRITPREILRQFDQLGPGEVITVRDGDDEVTITAEPRQRKRK